MVRAPNATGRVNRGAGKASPAVPGSGAPRGRLGNACDPIRASVSARWASIGMASR